MRLKMILPGDTREVETDMEVFSLANIKSKQVLTAKVVESESRVPMHPYDVFF